jgi:hypothetical protein
MPFGSVQLLPGVNVEATPTLLQAAISQSQYIRYKAQLVQKLGGWQRFFKFTVAGVPMELHPWQDLNGTDHLGVGTTTALVVITSGESNNITPQVMTTNPAVNFSTIINTTTITIVDPGINNVTVYDSIAVNTPVAIGGVVLSGAYPIASIVSPTAYTITAATAATSTVNNAGAVPVFTTTISSAVVNVNLAANGIAVAGTAVFAASTTGNGVTIAGAYEESAITDANNFSINVATLATSSGSFSMNGGNAQIVYYIAIGPFGASTTGYGVGGYGAGGYGIGSATSSNQQTGAPVAALDWTSDNWGEIFLSCPANGGVYQWNPTGGFSTAQLVGTAPVFNGGIFVSQQQEILVCWASTVIEAIGNVQDPLTVAWSNVRDFTNFTPTSIDQAGNFRIPTGSKCVAGMAVANQDLIWTDLDLWGMNYLGPPFVFGFNLIGAGAGAISSHAVQKLRGGVYWMGQSNFYALTSSGVNVLPCTVWDFVFQNLNTAFQTNVRAMPNTPFNEAGWLFPSSASNDGTPDSYVKMNILEPNAPWDYGLLDRSAWTDQSVFGPPIGATDTGLIFQHEIGNDADGSPLMASFTTGYFFIAEGEDFSFVDQILPDFKWGFFGSPQTAQVQITINALNYPGDTPQTFGPFLVTQATEYVSVRIRARQMSFTIASNDSGSFWRIGRVRYRYGMSGRR